MKNFLEHFSNPQAIQTKIKEVEEAMDGLRVTGESGGGAVQVTLNGKRKIIKLSLLDESFIHPSGKKILEDLIVAAFNDAVTQLEQASLNILE